MNYKIKYLKYEKKYENLIGGSFPGLPNLEHESQFDLIIPFKNMVFPGDEPLEKKLENNDSDLYNKYIEYSQSQLQKYKLFKSFDPKKIKNLTQFYNSQIKPGKKNLNQFQGFNFDNNKPLISLFCSNENNKVFRGIYIYSFYTYNIILDNFLLLY